jgi:DNA repair protein RecO (recombination protein O)
MDWQEPAIVLEATPYGEGDALASVLSAGAGVWRGMVRGGAGRHKSPIWQKGNLVMARWVARLETQLGNFSGELVHPAAALAMNDRLSLAVLEAACATACSALPEREPHEDIFAALARLMAGMGIAGFNSVAALVDWEVLLLRDLGFGLDFNAPSGNNDRLAYVSPRTGHAVTLSMAGEWVDRLFPLPPFMLGEGTPTLADTLAGLRITGHFLARDVFGAHHKPLPPARQRLYDLVTDRSEDQKYAG